MRFITIIAFFFTSFLLFGQNNTIVFTENKSQFPSNVLYKSNILGGTVFLEKEGLTYVFQANKKASNTMLNAHYLYKAIQNDSSSKLMHAYKVHFVNYNTNCKVNAENQIAGYENYFIGNDTNKWRTHVKSYLKVTYTNLWNGIDLIMYQNGSILKYDFVVHPGANPNTIKLKYEGIDSLKVTQNNIIIKTSVNEVTERKPVSYQYSSKGKDTVQSFYVLDDENKMLSYRIYKYDSKRTLFIDPELIFSTYTGSTSDNWGFTATFDNDGNVYSGGIVVNDGNKYPVSLGSFQQNNGGSWDIGIIKYNPAGTTRLFATYLGGSFVELPHSLVVNSRNELVIFGTTSSSDFPTKKAYDNTFNGGNDIVYDNLNFWGGLDLFVAQISPDGSNLLASTFIGGSKNDGLNFDSDIPNSEIQLGNDSLYFNYGDGARGEVIVDKSDNVYIGTCTFSTDFPIVGGFQSTSKGKEEGIVIKLNSNLSSILWSSYMGGSADDAIYSIDVDTANNVYITGGTNSTDLTTTATTLHPNSIGGSADAFVSKIKSDGSAIENATYWGSSDYDQAYFVRVDKQKQVYIYGQTRATGNTLLINALYGQSNSGQFVSKFNNTLDTVIWSTVFGTGVNQPNISPTAMSVDVCNRVYLAGVGREWPGDWISPNNAIYNHITHEYEYGFVGWDNVKGTKNMPLSPDAYQKFTDGQDFYFMVMDDKASVLDYATFFGEQGGPIYYNILTDTYRTNGCPWGGLDHVDGGTSRFDKVGNIYQSACASCNGCDSFPTFPNPGAWSNHNNSQNCNNATVVFRIHRDQMQANFTPKINPCNPYSITFTNTSVIIDTTKVQYTWDFGDKTPKAHVRSPQHVFAKTGTYIITLSIKDFSSCNFEDSVKYPITIIDTAGTIALTGLNICNGDSIALGKVFPADTSIKYLWTPATGLSSDTVANPYSHTDSTITYNVVVKQQGCQQTFSQKVSVFYSNYKVSIKQISGDSTRNVCFGMNTKLKLQMEEPSKLITWATDSNFINIIPPLPDSTIDVAVISDTMIYVRAVGKYCGTIATDSIKLKVIKPSFTKSSDTLICKGAEIEITVTNNNPLVPLTYTWLSDFVVQENPNSAIIKPDTSTVIHVIGNSIEGCLLDQSIIITVDNFNIDSSKFVDISCHNSNDGSLKIIAHGISPLKYLWDNADTNFYRSNLSQGLYTITVTDSLHCLISKTFSITNPAPFATNLTHTNVTCEPACNGALYTNTTGTTSPYRYKWNTSDTTSYLKNQCKGFYWVTITDSHLCSVVLGGSIEITNNFPQLKPTANKYKIYQSQSVIVTAIKNAPDSNSYHWMPEMSLENPDKAETIAHPDSTTTYFVVATDQYGCSSIDTITIFVRNFKCDEPYVFVPNAFSPNDDKINDILFVESTVVDSLYFAIYTRWGEKVFETRDITIGWDGMYKGEKLSPAVFVYYIDATCINKQRLQKKGNISLLR